jgi:hypothetical protein
MGIHCSFLKKFENANIVASNGGNTTLNISTIKHSGSLIMFSGLDQNDFLHIFAKNSTANQFTQLFAILIIKYFQEVFPENENAFYEFATAIYKMKITACFEFVAPKALGQHGGTPNMPYFVLTAITSPDSTPLKRNIWGIDKMLCFAATYRLPIVGGAIFPNGSELEILNHSKFHLESKGVEEFLATSEVNWAVGCEYPLSGEALQGAVCEGFVIKTYSMESADASQVAIDIIAKAATEYNSIMATNAPIANRLFASLNDRISAITTQEISAWYEKVVPYKELENIRVSEQFNLSTIAHLSLAFPIFATLFIRYGQQIKIKYYECGEGTKLAQIQVTNDDVFGSMGLFNTDGELYRGMVLTLTPENIEEADNLHFQQMLQIVQIVPCLPKTFKLIKIKCLRYIACTFAVRNNLSRITGSMRDKRLISNFLSNWSIPKEFHLAIIKYLTLVYEEFSKMDVSIRGSKYLEVVERIFNTPHPNNASYRAIFGHSSDISKCTLTTLHNLLVLNLSDMSSSEFERSMGIVPGVFTANVPSLSNSFTGKCIAILSKPDLSLTDNKKIDGICASLSRKGAACILKSPKNREVIIEYMRSNRIDCETSAIAPQDTPTLIVIIFVGMVIASGKSTITKELLKLFPNSASVSKEGLSTPVYKKNVARLATSGIDILFIDKNHPDMDGLGSTLSMLSQIKSISIKLLAVVPKELTPLEEIKCRIRDRIGKSFDEIGTTFIPRTEGLADGEWEKTLIEVFYEPARENLENFKNLSSALIVDAIHTRPKENARIIADRVLSQESVGAPLFDIIAPMPASSKSYTYIGVFLNDIVGNFHVTIHHTTYGPTPEVINGLIGQEVIVTYENYVKAKKGSKTISLWIVKSMHLQETGEELALSDSNLFHITDPAALRNPNSANAAMAKEVMEEIRESDDSAKYESSRVEVLENGDEVRVPKPTWRCVITPSSGVVSGTIKRM